MPKYEKRTYTEEEKQAYFEKRRMEKEQIIKELEDGVKGVFESEKYKEYLTVMSRFHSYSLGNLFRIQKQNPEAYLVAGYDTWREQGRYVKRGEKALRIVAPIFKLKPQYDKDNQPILAPDGKPLCKKELDGFDWKNVFDVSQTDGKPLPDIVNPLDGNVENYNKVLETLIEISPVPVAFEQISDGALGYFHKEQRRIAIQKDMNEPETLRTLVHEISHAHLHNFEDGAEKDKGRRTREVQAESVAFVVCKHLKIDTGDSSFGYIAEWGSDKNYPELRDSLNVIRTCSDTIIKSLDEKLLGLEVKNVEVKDEKQNEKTDKQSLENKQNNSLPNEIKYNPQYQKLAENLSKTPLEVGDIVKVKGHNCDDKQWRVKDVSNSLMISFDNVNPEDMDGSFSVIGNWKSTLEYEIISKNLSRTEPENAMKTEQKIDKNYSQPYSNLTQNQADYNSKNQYKSEPKVSEKFTAWKEKSEQARSANLVEYFQKNNYTIKKNGAEYYIKEINGLCINPQRGSWFSHYEGFGGNNSVDCLVKILGKDFKSAVEDLTGYSPSYSRSSYQPDNKNYAPQTPKPQPVNFVLPERANNNNRAIAYLIQTRKIPPHIVFQYIKAGKLYQDKEHGNAVFPHMKGGKIIGAELHGTLSNSRFKGISAGTGESVFAVTFSKEVKRAYVFESAIDLMSFQAIMSGKSSLNGVALISMGGLKPEVIKTIQSNGVEIISCVDNDEKGRKFEADNGFKRGYNVLETLGLKDWNELLQRQVEKGFQTEKEDKIAVNVSSDNRENDIEFEPA